MAGRVIGIDLGTLNSCVATVQGGKAVILSEDQRTTVPSCVAYSDDKELVGAAARRHAVTHPESTLIAVKRLLGHPFDSSEVHDAASRVAYGIKADSKGNVVLEAAGHELTPVQVAAKVLGRIVEMAEKALGGPVQRAVISVPAHFNDVQRKATKVAAETAGLDVLWLINEPTAAAFAYGYKKGEDFTLAVYDLGGGTFDITVMRARGDTFEVLATDGDSYLGGEDFDHAIATWLESEFEREHGQGLAEGDSAARRRLCEAAEKAKIELSQVDSAQIEVPYLAQIKGENVDLRATLSRDKLNELTRPLIEKTLGLVESCISQSGIGVSEIDDVLMVGGQSRMTAVREATAELFGREPRRDINPDEVVAMGAALFGYSLVADDLRDEAEGAAANAYSVALKGTEVARKLIDGIGELEARTLSDDTLAGLLKDLLQATGGDPDEDMLPSVLKLRAEGNLPGAVQELRAELYELDYKKQQLEKAQSSGAGSGLVEEAVGKINEAIESARSASDEAASQLGEAEAHASARKVTLLDVTSLPLGIASSGNMFSILIAQNTTVPTEAQRVFTTNQDGQAEVEIRVFQGRSKSADDNQQLGAFILEGIPPAPRMEPKIQVAFRIDDNGILSVRARDAASGAQHGMRVDDPLGLQQVEEGSLGVGPDSGAGSEDALSAEPDLEGAADAQGVADPASFGEGASEDFKLDD
jgi:molecular chaperone DnaK (HSP70)